MTIGHVYKYIDTLETSIENENSVSDYQLVLVQSFTD